MGSTEGNHQCGGCRQSSRPGRRILPLPSYLHLLYIHTCSRSNGKSVTWISASCHREGGVFQCEVHH